ncbi:hypothetical protein [Permianibacter aggregans]|uniref:Uncharacterized protein n=1 Tax=Permianibacter aggregans TaxID=1510150 RepID=A0A4R6UNN0_9GAMM|nr:hypothetical protein [Permianibacter aggregans]QGX38410.1 hypothetical protein E2H98_01505 [Permianibacter aggregans]TDQ48740.1 hypothetical protein EV696_106181 [Permianibacter aggregans]
MIVLLSFVLCACSSVQPKFLPRVQDEPQQVLILSHVPVSDDIHYFTAGQAWAGAVGGLIGAAIAADLGDGPHAQMVSQLRERKAEFSAAYHAAISARLGTDSRWEVVQESPDYIVQLSVEKYGLHAASKFDATMRLYWGVRFELYDAAGSLIWSKPSGAGGMELPVFTVEEYLTDPAKLNQAIEIASIEIANRLINSLNKLEKRSQLSEKALEGNKESVSRHSKKAP